MNTKITFYTAFLLLFHTALCAQMVALGKNLVPNSGFEKFSAPPIGWFYKGQHFTRLVSFWSSPTAASPDAFGPTVMVPLQWKEKGFGEINPKEGQAMAGITAYGCEGGKPHCREYLQVKLEQPLEIGQTYQLAFWAAHLEGALYIDQLAVGFNQEPINEPEDIQLEVAAVCTASNLLDLKDNNWHLVSTTFEASEAYQYLLIGNFNSDENTQTARDAEHKFGYAYYYIDDVRLRKINTLEDLSNWPVEAGATLVLNNIYFGTDQYNLPEDSKKVLQNIYDVFIKNPELQVEISGHTDDVGTKEYNLDLSEKRAQAVLNYLVQLGVQSGRIKAIGFGDQVPVVANDSKANRQKNRRVEFKVLKK